ncbi:MAG: PilT/PilU family type 4a pilus ATPase [Acidobacteriota bacterium]
MNLDALLQDIVAKYPGLSDIHFKVGRCPMVRHDGELKETNYGKLTEALTQGMAKLMLPDRLFEHFEKGNACDTSYVLPNICRFRTNIFRQKGTVALILRYIPPGIPSLDELQLPKVLEEISLYERGLVLCTGSAGCGKSTTLASMIEFSNQSEPLHIITIEEPIEFEYVDAKASVNQVEVGTDTPSFARSLRASLREDPDVILIGEMRDEETIDTGLKAAETGHLVFSTLHTTDATKTVNRLVDTFPPHQQQQVRYQVAANLKAVVSQRLVPRADGKGRVPAAEILIVTNIVQAYIIDAERTSAIPDVIAKSKQQYSMQTVDQHLTDLFKEGIITMEVALEAATNPSDFERALNFE